MGRFTRLALGFTIVLTGSMAIGGEVNPRNMACTYRPALEDRAAFKKRILESGLWNTCLPGAAEELDDRSPPEVEVQDALKIKEEFEKRISRGEPPRCTPEPVPPKKEKVPEKLPMPKPPTPPGPLPGSNIVTALQDLTTPKPEENGFDKLELCMTLDKSASMKNDVDFLQRNLGTLTEFWKSKFPGGVKLHLIETCANDNQEDSDQFIEILNSENDPQLRKTLDKKTPEFFNLKWQLNSASINDFGTYLKTYQPADCGLEMTGRAARFCSNSLKNTPNTVRRIAVITDEPPGTQTSIPDEHPPNELHAAENLAKRKNAFVKVIDPGNWRNQKLRELSKTDPAWAEYVRRYNEYLKEQKLVEVSNDIRKSIIDQNDAAQVEYERKIELYKESVARYERARRQQQVVQALQKKPLDRSSKTSFAPELATIRGFSANKQVLIADSKNGTPAIWREQVDGDWKQIELKQQPGSGLQWPDNNLYLFNSGDRILEYSSNEAKPSAIKMHQIAPTGEITSQTIFTGPVTIRKVLTSPDESSIAVQVEGDSKWITFQRDRRVFWKTTEVPKSAQQSTWAAAVIDASSFLQLVQKQDGKQAVSLLRAVTVNSKTQWTTEEIDLTNAVDAWAEIKVHRDGKDVSVLYRTSEAFIAEDFHIRDGKLERSGTEKFLSKEGILTTPVRSSTGDMTVVLEQSEPDAEGFAFPELRLITKESSGSNKKTTLWRYPPETYLSTEFSKDERELIVLAYLPNGGGMVIKRFNLQTISPL